MIFSSSSVMGIKMGDSFYYLKRHLLYLLAGFFVFIFALNLDLQKLKKYTLLIFCVSIFFLLLLFVPFLGKSLGGATRWLDFYFISFQPSEFVKFTMVLFFATYLSALKNSIKKFLKGLLPLLLVLVVVCGIIIKQPDMGTALSIAVTSFLMFFIAGANVLHLVFLGSCGGVLIFILSIFSAYRVKRLLAFLNPWEDPLGKGFQIIQSLLAVGSGGVIGLGIGNSKQKFYYLPQQYADFIFAVLCEELGFIGAFVLICIFLVFFFRGIQIISKTKDEFYFFLGFGIISMFFVQTVLNIMVVIALLPTTGLPLPFVSYGGTSMITCLFSVGLLTNISKQISL